MGERRCEERLDVNRTCSRRASMIDEYDRAYCWQHALQSSPFERTEGEPVTDTEAAEVWRGLSDGMRVELLRRDADPKWPFPTDGRSAAALERRGCVVLRHLPLEVVECKLTDLGKRVAAYGRLQSAETK